jgi:hypothetical protein
MVRLRKNAGIQHVATQTEIDAADMTGATAAEMILWQWLPIVLFCEPILLVFKV